MFTLSTIHNQILRTLIFFLMTLTMNYSAEASVERCDAIPLDTNETLRMPGIFEEKDCFQIDVPEAGVLMIDVTTSPHGETDALLGRFRQGCGSSGEHRFETLDAFPSARLLATDGPQNISFCVASQDPRKRLDEYRVKTAFSSAFLAHTENPRQEEDEAEGLRSATVVASADHTENPRQEEDEAEGLRSATVVASADHTENPRQEEDEAEGLRSATVVASADHTENPRQEEDEAEGLRHAPQESLCPTLNGDDHADSFLCATPIRLGASSFGRIANDWGDDEDWFTFQAEAVETMRIRSIQDGLAVMLYDADGQIIATSSEETRILKTLRPGRYFVRVAESEDFRGEYELKIDTVRKAW